MNNIWPPVFKRNASLFVRIPNGVLKINTEVLKIGVINFRVSTVIVNFFEGVDTCRMFFKNGVLLKKKTVNFI